MSFEAYRVAVRLSLINNVSTGLVLLSGQFQTLNRHIGTAQNSVHALERQILSLKRLGLAGVGMTVAGGFGLSLFKGPLDAAREYETAYARFKTLNLGDVVNRQADSFARGTAAWGTSSRQLMDTLRESYGMIGDMEKARVIAPMIASLNSANAMLFGGKVGAIGDNATRSIMRFIDMRGLTNTPQEIKHGLDLAQKLVTGSGGALKFSDLESFAKRGGTAFKSMSDEGLLYMATVMQEMGGSSAGTGLMSAYQNLVAGRTPKKAMAALQDLGLAKLGYIDHGTVGGKSYRTLQIKEMEGQELLRQNFPLWIMKYVIPALERKGITDTASQAAMVNDILSNRTGSNLGVSFTTQMLQTLRDARMVERAMGVDQTIATAKKTPDGAFIELNQKWKSLLTELGITILPLAIKGVTWLNETLRGAIAFTREFPLLTKGILIAFGTLAAVVAVGGTLALATAAFKALGLALTLGNAGTVAGALSATAVGLKAVGAASGAFMALYAGWKLGDYAGSKIDQRIQKNTGGAHGSLRSWLDETAFGQATGWFKYGQDEALHFQQAKPFAGEAGGSRFVAGNIGQTIQVNTKINLDGRKVGEIVSKHQARAMGRQPTGPRVFDESISVRPVSAGATGGW